MTHPCRSAWRMAEAVEEGIQRWMEEGGGGRKEGERILSEQGAVFILCQVFHKF